MELGDHIPQFPNRTFYKEQFGYRTGNRVFLGNVSPYVPLLGDPNRPFCMVQYVPVHT